MPTSPWSNASPHAQSLYRLAINTSQSEQAACARVALPETGVEWPARPALSPPQVQLVLQALLLVQLAFALLGPLELLWTHSSRELLGEATASLSRMWFARPPVFETHPVTMAAVTTTAEGKTKLMVQRWLPGAMHSRPMDKCLKLVHCSFHCHGHATTWGPQMAVAVAMGPDCGLQSAVRSTQRHLMAIAARAAACSAMLVLKATA
mmetsp:Transcript_68190/g.131699  ORF Transcript_68190/g.131699 Transcript_68190/m.131699 type:complete len:207 (-) Transcript_68190:222-842(-)